MVNPSTTTTTTRLRFAPAGLAAAILLLVMVARQLSVVPRAIGIAAVIISFASAAFLQRRDVRAHGTVVTAIAGVIAAGQTDAGFVYGIGVGLFLLICLASMREARLGAAPPRAKARDEDNAAAGGDARVRARSLLILFGTGACVTTGFLVVLPPLSARVERRFESMFGANAEEATAFSATMVLGSTRGMLQSDKVVMHVDLEPGRSAPSYLRGAVYDHYDGRHWVTTAVGRHRKTLDVNVNATSTPSRITLVRGTPNGEDMRWFLPSGACDLATNRKVQVDGFGIARRGLGEDPATLTFRTAASDCAQAPEKPIEPQVNDTSVNPDVRSVLKPLAAEWIEKAGATTDRARLAAIETELGRFQYSLAVKRSPKLDPLVDFVTLHRAGHCEMFASAMVLMARTQGIPARVIGGYRFEEINPLTGRGVVRDRHAHAWVEAWVDGGWREFDPTPTSDSAHKRAGLYDNIGDVVSSWIDGVASWINRLSTLSTAGVLAAFVVVLLVIRYIGQQLGMRRRARKRRLSGAGTLPLPCFDALTDALAEVGHARDESEPIESFAERIASLEQMPWAENVAEIMLRYAGLRYGDVGEEHEIVADVNRVVKLVRARQPG